MTMTLAGWAIAIFLPVLMVSVFAFTSIATWADARRREREAFYRSETLKKIAETSGSGGAAALEIIREQDRIAQRRRREDQRLGGLATTAAGIGLLISLRAIVPNQPVYLVGLIPVLVGLALLAHTLLFGPGKEV
jgi:hypothetical protein